MDGEIVPNWPAPNLIRALTTTRKGGFSYLPYNSFNLAMHVEDDPQKVMQNRLKLSQRYHFNTEPAWLKQTHSNKVIEIKPATKTNDPLGFDADGAWTKEKGVPCVVLHADCLPLLLCDRKGTFVAAIHCGWRGIANGIIENALSAVEPHARSEILAWLGPGIGPTAFEVGDEFKDLFVTVRPQDNQAFKPHRTGKWLADIYQLAKNRLKERGITSIYGGELCTFTDPESFFSHRRDARTGRMATLIWIEQK